MNKVKVGILGLGWFGNEHLGHLLTRDDVEVTALASTNAERLVTTGQRVPDARHYPGHREMLAGEKALDALFICVPPAAHDGAERDAAAQGIHLYVEKPLDVSWHEAVANQQAIRDAGILCAVGYQSRYTLGLDEAVAALQADTIGMLQGEYIVSMPGARWWRTKATSGGQVVEQSTHALDLMRLFAGKPREVIGMPRTGIQGQDVDDGSVVTVRFESGAVAVLTSACFNRDGALPSRMNLTVLGTAVQADLDIDGELRLTDAAGCRVLGSTEGNKGRAVDAFIDAVKLGDGSGIRSTYDDAMETFRLSLAAEKAIATGRCISVCGTDL